MRLPRDAVDFFITSFLPAFFIWRSSLSRRQPSIAGLSRRGREISNFFAQELDADCSPLSLPGSSDAAWAVVGGLAADTRLLYAQRRRLCIVLSCFDRLMRYLLITISSAMDDYFRCGLRLRCCDIDIPSSSRWAFRQEALGLPFCAKAEVDST